MRNLLLKCGCGRRFPLNPSKHQKDKEVLCPSCLSPVPNPAYNPGWLPRPREIKERVVMGNRELLNALAAMLRRQALEGPDRITERREK